MYDKKQPYVTLTVTDQFIAEASTDLESGTSFTRTLYPNGNVTTVLTIPPTKDDYLLQPIIKEKNYYSPPYDKEFGSPKSTSLDRIYNELKRSFSGTKNPLEPQPLLTCYDSDSEHAKKMGRILLGKAFIEGEIIPETFQPLLARISSEKGKNVSYEATQPACRMNFGLTG